MLSPVWKTKEGTPIMVSKMADSHLENALAWVIRKSAQPYYVGSVDPFGNDHYCDMIDGGEVCKDGITLKDWKGILQEELASRERT